MSFTLVGGIWTLFGLVMLLTGSVSIPALGIVFSKRHARVVGAVTAASGLIVVSIGIFPRPEWFEPREVALGGFFVFFVAVAVLATIMSAVQLVRWARDGEGAGEVRKRAWTVAVVLVFQTAFLVFIGIMFTTL